MGYYAETEDTDFTIPASKTGEALAALLDGFRDAQIALTNDDPTLAEAVEALSGFRECVDEPDTGFTLGYHCDKYLTGTDELLGILARYATEGSYVRFRGEDSCLFGFRVSAGQLRSERGQLTWAIEEPRSGGDEVCDEAAEYRVGWSIDIEAGGPEDAARQALVIQRDADSIATVFEVHRLRRDERGHLQPGQARTIDFTR